MDDSIRSKLAEISAQWRSAGKIGPAVSKSVSQAYELGKAEGIKEGLRRAAALLRNVEWTDAAMATAGFDEQCEDIYSAAILKEIGE